MPALSPPELGLGRLVLWDRAVSAEQLADCLEEREARARRGEEATALGALLVQRGLLPPDTLASLLARVSEGQAEPVTRLRDADGRLERRVLTEGLLSPAECDRALRVRDRLSRLGLPLDLGEVLVADGLLAPGQVRDLLTRSEAGASDDDATVRPMDATRSPAAPHPAPPVAGLPPDQAVTAAPSAPAGGIPAGETTGGPSSAGRPFGRYRLLRELGRGGMGVVHQAWDGELRRHVALKLLLEEGAGSGSDVERFLREAQAAARLRHPGIVQVHDVGTHEGRHYFTMDFIEGENLEAAKKALPLRRFLELLRDVAIALEAAHSAGIVHRDVKPQNILLDRAGRAYVSDFGLAKQVRAEAAMRGQTVAGEAMGTPHYMSPEQAQGLLERIGPASDVWSLGVILYERLAGRFPFVGQNLFHLLGAIVAQEPPAPSRLPDRRVQRDLETICLKCLEKEPSRRYGSAAALAAELERFLAGEPVEARPATVAYRVQRWVGRRPGAAAALGGLALLGSGLLWSAAETRRQEARAAQAQQARETLEQEVIAQVREKAGMLLEITLDQRRRGVLRRKDGQRLLEWIRTAVRQADERIGVQAEPHHHLAVMLHSVGELAEAERELTLALDHAGEPGVRLAEMRYDRGIVRAEMRRRHLEEKRLELWRERVGRGPASESGVPGDDEVERAHPSIAAARDRAVGDLVAALAVSGGSALTGARADVARGILGLLRGEAPEQVERNLQAALAKDERLPEAYLTLANLASRRGDFVRAADWCRRGLAVDQAHHVLICEYANAAGFAADSTQARGAREDAASLRRGALTLLERRLEVDPDSAILWSALAGVCWRNGVAADLSGEDAERVYRAGLEAAGRALDLETGRTDVASIEGALHRSLGDSLAGRGADPESSYRAALAAYDRALGITPGSSRDMTSRALVHLHWGRWRVRRGADPREDYRAALAASDGALEIDPGFAGAAHNWATAHWFLGEWQAGHGDDPRDSYRAALAGFDRAMALDPKLTDAVMNRAAVYASLGEWQSKRGEDPEASFREAIAGCDRALAMNPNHAPAAFNRAMFLMAYGDWQARRGQDPRALYQAALETSERASAIQPNRVDAGRVPALVQRSLGHWLAACGEDPSPSYRAAIAAAERALAIDPNLAEIANLVGMVELGLGAWTQSHGRDPRPHFRAAQAASDRALAIRPGYPEATNNRAIVHAEMARWHANHGEDPQPGYRAALEGFRQALGVDPGNPRTEKNLADCHRELGEWRAGRAEDPGADYREAQAGYDRALALDPNYAAAAHGRALVHALQGEWLQRRGEDPQPNFHEALTWCDRALKLNPGFREAQFYRVYLYRNLGRIDDAVAFLESAVAIRPGDAEMASLLAEVRMQRDLAGRPWLRGFTAARTALQAGDYGAAVAAWRGAFEALPETDGARLLAHPGGRSLLVVAHYDFACVLALTGVGRMRAGAPPVEVPATEAARLRDEAFAHLEHARECGWTDVGHLASDPDLASLRDDPRWAPLLARFGK